MILNLYNLYWKEIRSLGFFKIMILTQTHKKRRDAYGFGEGKDLRNH